MTAKRTWERASGGDADKPNAGITVVIPAYNEEGAIEQQLREVTEIMESTGRPFELIVIDDGSTDCTAERLAGSGVKLIRHEENYGYGASLKDGISHAKFDWILITDADGTYPSKSIPEMLRHIPEMDMVIGSRYGSDGHDPWYRRFGKWILRQYAGALAGQQIPDLNSGLRVIRKSFVETFHNLLPSGFSFTTTTTISAMANDYKVVYVPIQYMKRVGQSKIRPIDFLRIFALITRLVMLFNPMRILVPVGVCLLALGFLDSRYDVIPGEISTVHLSSVTGVLWLFGAMGQYRVKVPWSRVFGSTALIGAFVLLLPKGKLNSAFQAVPAERLIFSLPVFLAIHALGAIKWRMLLAPGGAILDLRRAVNLYFTGLFGNLFLPTVIGGDVVMVAAAMNHTTQRGALVVGSVVNRVLDLMSLAILALLGAMFMDGSLSPEGQRILHAASLIGGLFTLLCVGILYLLRPERVPLKLRDLYAKHEAALDMLKRPQLYAVPLIIAVVMQAGLAYLTSFIAAGCGLALPAAVWLWVFPLAKLAAFVPVTLGGIGAREVAFTALLAPFGVNPSLAVAVGLGWDGLLIGGGLAAGLIGRLLGQPAKELERNS